jgi:uncharacterized protein
MEWLAGPQGGGWYDAPMALVDQDNPRLGLKVAPGGGKENPGHLQEGDWQLGMSIDFLAAAYAGKPPYDRPMTKINTTSDE